MIVLSLGAGVQSSTMALMAGLGELTPMPIAAIFADTGDEPKAVYQHLAWLATKLPFPIHLTRRGERTLSQALLDGDDAARIPAFVKGSGLSGRQCTRNFKLRPIRQEVRRLLDKGPRDFIPTGSVEMWVGISTDESWRMKPSGAGYIVNRFPLIEAGMSRQECKRWLLAHGFPIPPKSACRYCPYQDDARHLERQRTDPEDHQRNIDLDEALRTPENIARFRGELYLHRSRRPLAEVDFALGGKDQQDLFLNECEGMCGV